MHPGPLNSTDVEFTTPFVQQRDMHLYTTTFNMPVREQRRPPASFPIIIHKYASSESSASARISDAALSSPDDSMQGPDLACNPEQLEYPARPLTPDYPLQGSDLTCNLEQLEDPARPMVTDDSISCIPTV